MLPIAKDKMQEVQNLNSEHLVCNSAMWELVPHYAGIGLRPLETQDAHASLRAGNVHVLHNGQEGGEEPTTCHLPQKARKLKDVIGTSKNILKWINTPTLY